MANKPSFFGNKKNLVKASILALLATSASVPAFGAAGINRTTQADGAVTNTGADWDQDGTPANAAVAAGSYLTIAHDVTNGQVDGTVYSAINVIAAGKTFATNNSVTVGAVYTANPANTLNFNVVANKTLTLNGVGYAGTVTNNAAGNADNFNGGAVVNDNDFSGLGNIVLADSTATLAINLANGNKTANLTQLVDGGAITIAAGNNITFSGLLGSGNGITNLTLTGNAQVTLAANAVLDSTAAASNITLGNGAVFTVNDGITLTAAGGNAQSINGNAANNGTLTFVGASTVTGLEIGKGQPILALNLGNNTVEFKGNAANSVINAKTITFADDANSVMKLSTVAQTVTGNLVAAGDGVGSIQLKDAAHTIAGTVDGLIGANGNALGSIVYGDNNTALTIKAANNKAANVYVNNIVANAANNGDLTFQGNLNLYTTIGTDANGNAVALNTVSLLDDANGAAATFTLKENNSITANALQISNVLNNTLELEEGTVINAPITTGGVNTGIITLKGDSTINNDIGTNANAVSAVNLGNFVLSFGGANIYTQNNANGVINFNGVDAELKLTNNANTLVKANLVAKADNDGGIDGTIIAGNNTLTVSGTIGAANKGFGGIGIGSGKLILSAGDAVINAIGFNGDGTVQLDHNTYVIKSTINTAGQGTFLAGGAGGPGNGSTLANGTLIGGTVDNGVITATPVKTLTLVDDLTLDTTGGLPAAQGNASITVNAGSVTGANNSLIFQGGGLAVINANLGDAAGLTKIKGIQVNDANTVASVRGAYMVTTDPTEIDNGATFQIGGNFTTPAIQGKAADNGTLEFVNNGDITVNLTNQAGAVNSLALIKLSGVGAVKLATAGAGANAPVVSNVITFAPSAGDSVLYLPANASLNGINITSTAGNQFHHAVVVSGIDQVIAAGQKIGTDANNLVGLGLGSDNSITVNEADFYSYIVPTVNGKGTATLSAANGQIYGLGAETPAGQILKLKTANITEDYTNFGETYVNNLTVSDGKTYTATQEAVDSNIMLGDGTGANSAVVFAGPGFLSTSSIKTASNGNGAATFIGDTTINNNIGVAGSSLSSLTFTGANAVTTIAGQTYANQINFGTNQVNLSGNATLNGAAQINRAIILGHNNLTFANGSSTLGDGIILSTTLQNNTLGQIIVDTDTAKVKAVGKIIPILLTDNQVLSEESYTLVSGGSAFAADIGTFEIDSNQAYAKYKVVRAGNQDIVLKRFNDSATGVTTDLTNSGVASTVGESNIAAFINPQNTGDAAAALANIGTLTSSDDRSKAIVATTVANSNIALVSQANSNLTVGAIGDRLSPVRYLTPDNAPASGDEDEKVSYGAWAKPFYVQTTQKKKGDVAGYKAKTTGGVFGLDGMVNDNLIIGAAVGITKTDMKHRDYKAGDKTTINGFSFSLYGTQQLVDNFFVQALTTFTSNQVKNKAKRYMADANRALVSEVATGKYDNMTYGGELLLGYDAKPMENILFTPMVGVRYMKSSDEAYKETGTTFLNKEVSSKFSDKTDAIIGARVVGRSMDLSGVVVIPEAHAFVTQKIGGKIAKVQSRLNGQVDSFTGQADKTAKTFYNAGLSVTAKPGPRMEYGIGYDAHIASKFVAHQGTLKVRVNF